MNIIVQLRNQLIECSLLGFHAALLAGLDSRNNRGKLTDLENTFVEVVLVLFLDLELELSESIVNLSIQIDHVTDILELFINVVEMAGLLYELVDVFDLLRQIRNALAQPLLLHISPLSNDLWH